MKQIALINLENVSEKEALAYKTREAARAIVLDNEGKMALLHATKNFYFKLPGGGVEKGEDMSKALQRECIEEIGCKIEVKGEVGLIQEYRKRYNLNQISHCYIARLVGEKGQPELTQDEIDEGFETVWMPIADALQKLRESKPVIYEGPYMVARDTAFLEAYARSVSSQ